MTPSEKANRQYWADKRSGRSGPATKVSVTHFVAEANKRLHEESSHQAGTRFIVIRRSTDDVEGSPTWEGPETMRSLVQRIVQELTGRYEVSVPFRIDR